MPCGLGSIPYPRPLRPIIICVHIFMYTIIYRYISIYVCAGLEKNHRIPALGLMATRACLHELRNNCAGPG